MTLGCDFAAIAAGGDVVVVAAGGGVGGDVVVVAAGGVLLHARLENKFWILLQFPSRCHDRKKERKLQIDRI